MKNISKTTFTSLIILTTSMINFTYAAASNLNDRLKDYPLNTDITLTSDYSNDNKNVPDIANGSNLLEAQFIIIDLHDLSDDISDEAKTINSVKDLYNKKFGDGVVKVIDGHNATVSSLHAYLLNQAAWMGSYSKMLWIISNHGLAKTTGDTQIFWGNKSEKIASIHDFEDLPISNQLFMSWFDACYTGQVGDGIDKISGQKIDDGTIVSWMNYYKTTDSTYACGFNDFTDGNDVNYSACVFKNVLPFYTDQMHPYGSNTLPASKLSEIMADCHQQVSINTVSPGAPYCSGNSTNTLPKETFKYIRIMNDINPSAGGVYSAELTNINDTTKHIKIARHDLFEGDDPAYYTADGFAQLITGVTDF